MCGEKREEKLERGAKVEWIEKKKNTIRESTCRFFHEEEETKYFLFTQLKVIN